MNDMTRPDEERKAHFPALLKNFLPEIQRALPKHMNADRMARIALTAFRQTPALADCDPRSIFAAVIQSSQLGLEVGLMGEAHLVPFKGKCQLIPGYQGLMKLARNSGLVEDIYAHEVREKDRFECVLGLTRSLVHEPLTEHGFPASEEKRGAITGFYAVAVFKDGTKSFVAMSRAQVDAIRDGSNGYQMAKKYKKQTPWDTHYVEMGLKTVIRRLCKYMPKSPELAAAVVMDDTAMRGKEQGITLEDAIDGTWTPAADEETQETKEPEKPALPELSAAEFDRGIKGWRKTIAEGKKTADEVLAMLRTRNTLTREQEAAIILGPPDAKAAPEDVAELAAKADENGLTGDLLKHLKVKTLEGITVAQVLAARAFIADPTGGAQ